MILLQKGRFDALMDDIFYLEMQIYAQRGRRHLFFSLFQLQHFTFKSALSFHYLFFGFMFMFRFRFIVIRPHKLETNVSKKYIEKDQS